jgi:drug/metabolite transporter (DMT)-like permease
MPYLIIVSVLWAFSFGLIKGRLAGLDGAFISAARLGLALLVLLPFLRMRRLPPRLTFALLGIGAVQFGIMYLAYNESFHYLPAYAVALFTITTPILVTLLADAFDQTWRGRALLAALVAVVGSAVLVWQSAAPTGAIIKGFVLVQVSNAAFALGQVLYRRIQKWPGMPADKNIFALLYAGGFIVSLSVMLAQGSMPASVTFDQRITLLYLGAVSSGLGFFLWNRGATQVTSGTLAVMNNAKVPLAVACSLIFFGESADLPRLAASLALMAVALWLNKKNKFSRS